MTRYARSKILYDGCYAHVFSRSIDTRWIFQEENDFEYFKRLLMTHKVQSGFRIHHYCLMNTHFHLAVSIPCLFSFSEALKQIKWSYTVTYNRRHKRRGPLWQERFKSLLIEDEGYLYACGLYIENNPVKAGMAKRAPDWLHSSARYYENKAKDALVDGYDPPPVPSEAFSEGFFTEGKGIGSELFRIQLNEELVPPVPVT